MGVDEALALLERAQTRPDLPRLGGVARPNGVVIVSERYWAFAGVDGTLREGTMPSPPRALARVPLVRGLARLWLSLSPLFRGTTGVARPRERRLLALAVVTPPALAFAPQAVSLPAAVATSVALVAWMLRGRTLFLHGAEHRAIAAVDERRLVATWTGDARPTRFASRCGTNFAALAVPVTFAADRLWPLPGTLYTPAAVTLLSLALTMELWKAVQAVPWRFAR